MAEGTVGTVFVDIEGRNNKFNDAVKEAQNTATKAAQSIEVSFARVKEIFYGIAATAGISFSVNAIVAYAKETVMLAARVDTLSIVLKEVGKNAGYVSAEMRQYVEAVKTKGITTQAATDSVIKMAQAEMDLTKSSQFARIAQDAAVIANTNSSDAFQRMTYAVKAGQTEMLRTMGLNVTFEASYQKLASTLGKTAAALTEKEKVQARMNAVMEYGAKIEGVYEASLTTAGKALHSLSRYTEEVQYKLGQAFQPAFKEIVDALTVAFKGAGEALDKFKESGNMTVLASSIATAIKGVIIVLSELASVLVIVTDSVIKFKDAIIGLGVAFASYKFLIFLVGFKVSILGVVAAITSFASAVPVLLMAISGLLTGLGLLIKAFTVSHPILLAISIALGLAAMAYSYFSSSTDKATTSQNRFNEGLANVDVSSFEDLENGVRATIYALNSETNSLDKSTKAVLARMQAVSDLYAVEQRGIAIAKEKEEVDRKAREAAKSAEDALRDAGNQKRKEQWFAVDVAEVKGNTSDAIEVIKNAFEIQQAEMKHLGASEVTIAEAKSKMMKIIANKEHGSQVEVMNMTMKKRMDNEKYAFDHYAFKQGEMRRINSETNKKIQDADTALKVARINIKKEEADRIAAIMKGDQDRAAETANEAYKTSTEKYEKDKSQTAARLAYQVKYYDSIEKYSAEALVAMEAIWDAEVTADEINQGLSFSKEEREKGMAMRRNAYLKEYATYEAGVNQTRINNELALLDIADSEYRQTQESLNQRINLTAQLVKDAEVRLELARSGTATLAEQLALETALFNIKKQLTSLMGTENPDLAFLKEQIALYDTIEGYESKAFALKMQRIQLELTERKKLAKSTDEQKALDVKAAQDTNKAVFAFYKVKADKVQEGFADMEKAFLSVRSMYKEGTSEYEEWTRAAKAMAVAQKVVAVVNAVAAIATQGLGDPYTAFARIAAMAAAMGALLANIGESVGGGASSAAKASVTVPGTTVLGAQKDEKTVELPGSESLGKVAKLLESIHADEYSELQGIHDSINALNRNIEGLVISIVRMGIGNLKGMDLDLTEKKSSLKRLWEESGITGSSWALKAIEGPITEWVNKALGSVAGWIFGGDTTRKLSAWGVKLTPINAGMVGKGEVRPVSMGQMYGTVTSTTAGPFGGAFGGGGTSTNTSYTPLVDEEANKFFYQVYKNITKSAMELAKVFGTDMEDVMKYMFPEVTLDLLGLSPEEITTKLQSWISDTGDVMAKALFGELIGKYAKIGEGMLETAIRVATELVVVRDMMSMIGKGVSGNTAYMIAWTQAMVDANGGLENFQKNVSLYFEKFFSSAERAAAQLSFVNTGLKQFNVQLPTTREGLRALVQGIDTTTVAGQAFFAYIMSQINNIDAIYTASEQIAKDRSSLEIRIMELTGQKSEALAAKRRLELAAMDASLRGLQSRVWALEDAELARIEEEEAARVAAQLARDRATKEVELMGLLGMASESLALKRTLELEAMDESLRGIQNAIWAITDAKSNLDKAEADLRASFRAQTDEMQKSLEETNQIISILQGFVNKLKSAREGMQLQDITMEKATYKAAQMDLARALQAVRSGDLSVLENIDDTLSKVTGDTAKFYTNSVDYKRDYWKTYNSIKEMEELTGDSLSIEETIAQGIQDQISYMAAQLDAILGVGGAVLSVAEALGAYQAALGAWKAAVEVGRQVPIVGTSPGGSSGSGGGGGGGGGSYLDRYSDVAIDPFWSAMGGWYHYNERGRLPSENRTWSGPTPPPMTLDEQGARYLALNPDIAGNPYWSKRPREHYLEFGSKPSENRYWPNYAEGGYHEGGYRVVGEQGPELEYTGPSSIFSNAQSQALLDMSEVVEEVRLLRQDLEKSNYQMLKNSNRVTKFIDKWDGDGLPDTRTLV